jgi:hypothetical protein
MQNVNLEVQGNKLVVTIDLSKPGEKSKSGKSTVIGSTKGNVSIPGYPEVKLGVNCYR